MKKNRLFAALAAAALTLSLLAGCGVSAAPADTAPDTSTLPASVPAPAPKPEDQKPDAADASMSELIGVLGLPDGELRTQLGDGTASISPEDVLIAREYTHDVLGESGAAVSMVFSDHETVSCINVNFQITKFDDAKAKLSADYGTPAEEHKSEESGGQIARWATADCNIELIDAYEMLSLSLSAAT